MACEAKHEPLVKKTFCSRRKRALSLFEYKIYYSLEPHLKKQQAFRCTPARANFLLANVHLRERTKQSWMENGCSCLFVVIWITEYASRGDKVCMRKLSMIFWSFPSTLSGFSSGSCSCADEKSNNPLDVIIPCSRANSSLRNSFSTESHLPPSSEERDLLSV